MQGALPIDHFIQTLSDDSKVHMFTKLEELLSVNDETAIQLIEEKADEITDELVVALEEAFRIMHAEFLGLSYH